MWKRIWQRGLALTLIVMLALAPMAMARSGGRIGGGSFRSIRPPSSYTVPRGGGGYGGGSYGGGGYYPGGGGIGFPFLLPFFFGGGGGSFLTLLLVFGAGSFVLRALRSGALGSGSDTETVHVAELQVGLLANARSLQAGMDTLARRSDPSDPQGLSRVLQEITLMLNRHQEYWAYGHGSQAPMSLQAAEQRFNQLSLQERSKFSAETLVNLGLSPAQASNLAAVESDDVGEYLVVTLLVAYRGQQATLPVVDSAADLQRCLVQLGAIGSEQLLAMEVLWTPQAKGDTLTALELTTEYPQLLPL